MKIFKFLIPKDDAQEITELESFTLRWEIQGDVYQRIIVKHKSFIKEDEAKEFEKQLKSSAEFLGTWVNTKYYRN